MKAKVTELSQKLERELQRHYDRLLEAFPLLDGLGLMASSPHNDPIWLPSRITLPEAEELGLKQLWEAETNL